MIRFAWLQSRTQALTAAAVVAAAAIAAAITGVQLAHLYSQLVVPCQAHGDCGLATGEFLTHDGFLQQALPLLQRLAPAVIGIFWGAPLLTRELENGTYRLAWTQTVSRSRWILTKLAFIGLTTAALTGVLTLTVTWWFRDIDVVSANTFGGFDTRDIAPIGYAVFGFALGALLGTLIRRTLPAMASTLGAFIFARVAVMQWVRPHLLSPLHTSVSLLNADQFGFMSRNGAPLQLVARASGPTNSWTLSSQFVTSSGHVATTQQLAAFVHQHCPGIGTPPAGPPLGGPAVAQPGIKASFQACREQAAQTYHLVVTYLPASRYWPLQWLETGIFLALALLAGFGCYWWVTRRTS